MNFEVKFKESNQSFDVEFGKVIQLGQPLILPKEITENGTYRATEEGANGYSPVVVNVPIPDGYIEAPDAAAGLAEFPQENYLVNGADLTAVGEAIAAKSGVEKPVFPDGWKAAVDGIEDIFVVPATGKQYTKHFQNITGGIKADHTATTNFINATELVSFETDLVGNGYCFASKVFSGCSKLESVIFSRLGSIVTPVDIYYGCNALRTIQLGSIGYPVGALSDARMMRGCSAAVELTIYVDATTIDEIPGAIKSHAPWYNANATIVYRNSTTGEVITE